MTETMRGRHLAAVLLAAGKGTRMGSDLPKVLHEVGGLPLIVHGMRAVAAAGCARVVIVVGHGAEQVKAAARAHTPPGVDLSFALQEVQLGTGHAALSAAPSLEGFEGDMLILPGDVPLARPETLSALVSAHRRDRAVVTVLTTLLPDAKHYGRIVRDDGGLFQRIVEARDSSPQELQIREINTGAFAVDAQRCFELLRGLGRDNAQGEYYLTDVVGGARSAGEHVLAYLHGDSDELMGINDRRELATAEALLRERINDGWMGLGVTFIDPRCTYISPDAKLGRDSHLEPGVLIDGGSEVGAGCRISAGARLINAALGVGVSVGANAIVEGRVPPGEVIPPGVHYRGDV